MLKTCYSPRYYAKTHTNSMEKLAAVAEVLQLQNLVEFVDPGMIDVDILKQLHAPQYVDGFVNGIQPLASFQGFRQWNEQLRDAVLSVNAGQIVAAEIAWQEGIAANIAQGFHHAVYEYGGAYCTFNGLALVAQKFPHKKIFILDCDQHGGDGTAEFTRRLPNLFNFSICGQRFGCPSYERSIIHHIDQTHGTFEQYANAIEQGFQTAINWQADLMIYQAGMDCHLADRFGSKWLTTEMLYARDLMVFQLAKQHYIPMMFVLAGGYQKLDDLVSLHVSTFQAADQIYFK